jgi:hypothetical protein
VNGPQAIVRKMPLGRLFVVAVIAIALLGVVVWVTRNSALTAEERRVAGSWIIRQSPGQTDVYTFTADRQMLASRVDGKGLTVDEDPPAAGESWSVRDETLMIRRSKGGPLGLYNLVPWIHATSSWHIVSLTDDTLTVDGGPGTKQLVWKRSPTTPRRLP